MIVVPNPTKRLEPIKYNHPVKIEYEVQNTGDEPIEITNMGTQCGCTAATMSVNPIPANGSAIFSLVYNASHHGNINKIGWFETGKGQDVKRETVYFSVNVN